MGFIGFRENRSFEVNIDFWDDFGTNLAPVSVPKSIKIHKKSFLKGIYFLIDFCIDFLSILAQFWEPTWRHVGHDFALKGRPNASQDALESENPPRPPPDLDFHRFLVDFRSIFRWFFNRFFINFSSTFHWFLLLGRMTTTAPSALATHGPSQYISTPI